MSRQYPNRAIIFAAGRGQRLGSHTANLPKTLLNVGNMTIFDRMVESIHRVGIREIIVVAGYADSIIRKHVDNVTRTRVETKIEFIMNDNLEVGNINSYWIARRKMNESFILFNSDVLFHPRILDLLLKIDDGSALVVDDTKLLGMEEMKVRTQNGRTIKAISKQLDPASAQGEYIGITKMSPYVANEVLDKVRELLSGHNFPLYYEDAFHLVAKEHDYLSSCTTISLPWTEIDTTDDLLQARNDILPRILGIPHHAA